MNWEAQRPKDRQPCFSKVCFCASFFLQVAVSSYPFFPPCSFSPPVLQSSSPTRDGRVLLSVVSWSSVFDSLVWRRSCSLGSVFLSFFSLLIFPLTPRYPYSFAYPTVQPRPTTQEANAVLGVSYFCVSCFPLLFSLVSFCHFSYVPWFPMLLTLLASTSYWRFKEY